MNLPNKLTLLRVAMIPVFVILASQEVIWTQLGAALVFIIACVTDYLDGEIARKRNLVTNFGKFVDPIADKLSLLTLLGLFVSAGEIPLWVLAIILFKEVMMVIGGGVALKHGIVVYALPIGKVTTVTFVLSMLARFLSMPSPADILLWISVALSMVALVWYAIDLMKKLGLKQI